MSKAYPCVYCTDDLRCTKYTDDVVTSFCVLGPCRDARPSRADQIRYMSDEELAVWIAEVKITGCPGEKTYKETECDVYSCADCWLEWLKKEADNG